MSLRQILIKSNIRNYSVNFCEDPDFINSLSKTSNTIFIVDNKVWDYYSGGCLKIVKDFDHIILPIDEEKKSLETVQNIYDQIIRKAAKKNLNLISIGGGILQDITGFVASTLYRGINWFFVPTTLLAQADSCIGAKTSLNYKQFKNLIGTFYPPSMIYIHTPFLKTLDRVDFFSGVGEIAKLHLMGGDKDTKNFIKNLPYIIDNDEDILPHIIKRALFIKKSFIEGDEFDRGRRNLLNFGHCFGHAIETTTDFAIPHGQAVIIGIILANRIALNRGMLSQKTEESIRLKVLFPVLKMDLKDFNFEKGTVIKAMKQDKKRTGEDLVLVIMKDDHQIIMVNDLNIAEAEKALDFLRET